VVPQSPSTGTPTGTVNFVITGGNSPVNATVTLTNGQATFSTASLAAGTYTVTATYAPSAGSGYKASTSAGLAASVAMSTSTRITSSHAPSTKGQNVTFTAKINNAAATGTITFYVDGAIVATVGVSNGKAAYSTSGLAIGRHTIKAVYSGDGIFLGSSASFSQTVYRTTSRRL
jgi:hypothetical protein